MEIWKLPQLKYKAARGMCKTDEQVISAAKIAQVYSGLDLQKCLKGRKSLLTLPRKDAAISKQVLPNDTSLCQLNEQPKQD